jgi:hypothetical protein
MQPAKSKANASDREGAQDQDEDATLGRQPQNANGEEPSASPCRRGSSAFAPKTGEEQARPSTVINSECTVVPEGRWANLQKRGTNLREDRKGHSIVI